MNGGTESFGTEQNEMNRKKIHEKNQAEKLKKKTKTNGLAVKTVIGGLSGGGKGKFFQNKNKTRKGQKGRTSTGEPRKEKKTSNSGKGNLKKKEGIRAKGRGGEEGATERLLNCKKKKK